MKRNDNEWIRKHYYRKCQRLFRIVKIESSCYSFILKHRHKEAYCAETWRRLYIMFEWFLDNKEEYGFEYVYIDHGCIRTSVIFIALINETMSGISSFVILPIVLLRYKICQMH